MSDPSAAGEPATEETATRARGGRRGTHTFTVLRISLIAAAIALIAMAAIAVMSVRSTNPEGPPIGASSQPDPSVAQP